MTTYGTSMDVVEHMPKWENQGENDGRGEGVTSEDKECESM